MNFKCTSCEKYSHLDQMKTSTLETGTLIKCQFCGEVSVIAFQPVATKSQARRILTEFGVNLATADLSKMDKEN